MYRASDMVPGSPTRKNRWPISENSAPTRRNPGSTRKKGYSIRKSQIPMKNLKIMPISSCRWPVKKMIQHKIKEFQLCIEHLTWYRGAQLAKIAGQLAKIQLQLAGIPVQLAKKGIQLRKQNSGVKKHRIVRKQRYQLSKITGELPVLK
ncbi:MAG: hypothetical protein ACQEWW_13235 [Bacillota bacterium]